MRTRAALSRHSPAEKMAISGTVAMFSRLSNLRNVVISIGNTTAAAPSLSRNLCLATRAYSVDINSVIDTGEDDAKPKKKMSKAMKAYLERAREYDEFMKKEITEYQIGKRHLANMMGEDIDSFSQQDVNRSIKYLFPSSLYEKRARPIMEEPEKLFPQRKAAEFDESGRPYHFLFYTCKPNYHQVLHDIVGHIYSLNELEDQELKKGLIPRPEDKIDLLGSEWMSKANLEKHLLETIRDEDYEKFVVAVERLADHPLASRVKDFLMKYRTLQVQQTETLSVPELMYTPSGRPYITVKDCKRKTARADVTVLGNGTGKITINGKDITYFFNVQCREQKKKRGRDEDKKNPSEKQRLEPRLITDIRLSWSIRRCFRVVEMYIEVCSIGSRVRSCGFHRFDSASSASGDWLDRSRRVFVIVASTEGFSCGEWFERGVARKIVQSIVTSVGNRSANPARTFLAGVKSSS